MISISHLQTLFLFLAWARSQKAGKADRANNLFLEMERQYSAGNENLRPNVFVVNAVLNACAFTTKESAPEQNRAMEIAHLRLRELEKSDYGKPDQVTYGTFLKACKEHLPDSSNRQKATVIIFKKCIRDGQMGNMVLQQLKNIGPEELYRELLGRGIEEDIKMEDLPPYWWSNVVESKRRRLFRRRASN
jgi:hypothetical protein